MQTDRNCTRPPLDNAFSPAFLAKLRRPEPPSTAREAVLAGPWEAEEIAIEPEECAEPGHAWAVVRRDEPIAEGGRAFGVFRRRSAALLTAAVLPSLSTPPGFRLKRHVGRLGYALHHGREFVGHLSREEEGLLPRLDLARALSTDPHALAQVIEAVGPEALAILGRVLFRRV
jgi:hypothetical protein